MINRLCSQKVDAISAAEIKYSGKSARLPEEHERLIRDNINDLMHSSIPTTWLLDRDCKAIFEEYYWDGLLEFNGRKYRTYRNCLNYEFTMFSLVDKTWTASLASKLKEKNITKCLEVAAGNGWLSHALQGHGLNVKSTDIKKPSVGISFCSDVEVIDGVSAIGKYGNSYQALIISYPYPEMAVEFIEAWGNGKPLVYIGYGPKPGRNTAQIDFFEQFRINEIMDIPRWEGYPHLCLIGEKSDKSDQFSLVDGEYRLQDSLRSMLPHDVSDSW